MFPSCRCVRPSGLVLLSVLVLGGACRTEGKDPSGDEEAEDTGGDLGAADAADSGAPETTPWEGDLTGRAWRLDHREGELVSSEDSVLELFSEFFPGDFLLEVTAVDGDQVSLRLGLSDGFGGPQDACALTADLPVADFSGAPTWEIGPGDLPLPWRETELRFSEAHLTGTVSADGSELVDSDLSMVVDVVRLSRLFDDTLDETDPRAVCALFEGFGMSCEDCGDGEPYCLPIEIRDVSGVPFDGEVEPVTWAEASADPDCEHW